MSPRIKKRRLFKSPPKGARMAAADLGARVLPCLSPGLCGKRPGRLLIIADESKPHPPAVARLIAAGLDNIDRAARRRGSKKKR